MSCTPGPGTASSISWSGLNRRWRTSRSKVPRTDVPGAREPVPSIARHGTGEGKNDVIAKEWECKSNDCYHNGK
eukprot:4240478-Pyramimonas_sp.AAC.1